MKILGIDPDTQASGWAIVTKGPQVLRAGCVNTKHLHLKGLEAATQQGKKLALKMQELIKEVDGVFIESQQCYRYSYRRPIDPNKLILLAYVSGAAVGGSTSHEKIRLVPPREWKGNMSKGACHRKTIDELEGWSSPPKICKASAITQVTVDPSLGCEFDLDGLVGGGPWSEIMDAIGLAIYGLKRLKCG